MENRPGGDQIIQKQRAQGASGYFTNVSPKKYFLELYITGMTPRSVVAIKNVRAVCKNRLKDQCILKIIDMYQNPKLAKEQQIIASPTLIKRFPLPMRRLVGDMSNTDRLLSGLDLRS